MIAVRLPKAINEIDGSRKVGRHGAAFDIATPDRDPVAFEAAARAVRFLALDFCPRSGDVHVDPGPARQRDEYSPIQPFALADAVETPR